MRCNLVLQLAGLHPTKMEEVLMKSFSADKDERNQATVALTKMMNDPAAFQQFWSVVVGSADMNIRQAAAVYFYKISGKKKLWLRVPSEMRQSIKVSILERIVQEPEKKVKTGIIQCAGQLAMTEPDGWPELFKLIEESMASERVPEMRQLGMYVISILTEHATPLFEVHTPSLLNLFGSIITKNDQHDTPLAYLTVLSMKNFLYCYSKKDKSVLQTFEVLIPSVFEVIRAQCVANRADRSVECLGFFEALLEAYPRAISNNLRNIIDGLLHLAVQMNNEDVTCRVMDVISYLICSKTKKIAKNDDILSALFRALFEIISASTATKSNDEQYDVYNGEVTLVNSAVEVLDTLTSEVDPEHVMKHIMPILDAAAKSDNLLVRKAFYIIVGVLVENCPKQIRGNGIDSFLPFIRDGLNSDIPLLLNGSLFVLWRFVDHLRPEINLHLMEFLNPLLHLLEDINGRYKIIESHNIAKIYYVLSECCEILESSLEPALQFIVPVLIQVIKSNVDVDHRESAINVLGHAGLATKKAFRDYFPSVLEVLKHFLVDNLPDEQLPLQVQTFDTLGTLFRSLYVAGDDIQLVEEVIDVALLVTDRKNCGELRSGLYSMLSDCSDFMKEKMERYLPLILKLMGQSFESKDVLDGKRAEETSFNINTEGGAEHAETFSHDSQITEEKEEALMALGNLAYNIGAPFQPYFKESYLICHQLATHENQIIRAAAVEALANLYIAIKRTYSNDESAGIPLVYLQIVPRFADIVKKDENVDVVYAALEGYQKILKDIPQIASVLHNTHNQASNGTIIMGVVKSVLTEKSACQKIKIKLDTEDDDDNEDDDSDDDDDSDLEIEDNFTVDDLLVSAEEIIPLLGEAVTCEAFLGYFSSCQRHLLKLLEKNRPADIRESTSATLGICAKYLATQISEFALEFSPMIPTLTRDANDSVRNNVAFCIAQMILYGKEAMFTYYNNIISTLINWLSVEQGSNVADNIVGAIASMIVVDLERLPLSNVLPSFFRFLPLREDFDENEIVFKSFNTLLEREIFKDYFVRMAEVILISSAKMQIITDGARLEANKFFERFSRGYAKEREMIIMNLSDELKNHFLATFANVR